MIQQEKCVVETTLIALCESVDAGQSKRDIQQVAVIHTFRSLKMNVEFQRICKFIILYILSY